MVELPAIDAWYAHDAVLHAAKVLLHCFSSLSTTTDLLGIKNENSTCSYRPGTMLPPLIAFDIVVVGAGVD